MRSAALSGSPLPWWFRGRERARRTLVNSWGDFGCSHGAFAHERANPREHSSQRGLDYVRSIHLRGLSMSNKYILLCVYATIPAFGTKTMYLDGIMRPGSVRTGDARINANKMAFADLSIYTRSQFIFIADLTPSHTPNRSIWSRTIPKFAWICK
jgi:hypothetical protein